LFAARGGAVQIFVFGDKFIDFGIELVSFFPVLGRFAFVPPSVAFVGMLIGAGLEVVAQTD